MPLNSKPLSLGELDALEVFEENRTWQLLQSRLQSEIEQARTDLERQMPEAETQKLRQRIAALRWLATLPERILAENGRR